MKHCCRFSCYLSVYLNPNASDRNYAAHFLGSLCLPGFSLIKYFDCLSIKQSFMNYMVLPCREPSGYDFAFFHSPEERGVQKRKPY